LYPRERRAAVRERAEQEEERDGLRHVAFGELQLFGMRRGPAVDEVVEEAEADHEEEADDEGVGGEGEDRARLAHAAQVGDGDEGDEEEAERYLVLVQPVEARLLCGGGDW